MIVLFIEYELKYYEAIWEILNIKLKKVVCEAIKLKIYYRAD